MNLSGELFDEPLERGYTKLKTFTISAKFSDDSFGHVGSSKLPGAGLDLPVFKIDERPVIPSTTLKGAWRDRLERLLEEKLDPLTQQFSTVPLHLRPCIPTTRYSAAEKDRFQGKRWLTGCQVEFIQQKDEPVLAKPRTRDDHKEGLICPVCYFFGANGLQGFLRIGHLFPTSKGDTLYKQSNTARDRALDGVRSTGPFRSEHIKGGKEFKGILDLLLFDGTFIFGEPRRTSRMGEQNGKQQEVRFDPWLEDFAKKEGDLKKRRLALFNDLLIPAFQKIDILGGHRSKGGGRVKVEIKSVDADAK